MKSLHITLLILLPCFANAQQPTFVQNISVDKVNICSGENATFYAQVNNATYYQFQLHDSETGKWVPVSSGDLSTSTEQIEHTFYGLSRSPAVRILLTKGTDSLHSNTLSTQVHKPNFTIQPLNQVQCNGNEVIFQSTSPSATSYQWQLSTNGEASFEDLTVTTKYKDVTTPNLKVTGIINSHHNLIFRVRALDSFGCEAFSDNATLKVNQLPTAISPTLSTQFCEGDTAKFYLSSITGEPSSFQWQLRKTTQSTYSNLSETPRFAGVNTAELHVNQILPDENSYRLRVGFLNILQNGLMVDTSICYLESVRANYVVNHRPTKPTALDTLESCYAKSFIIEASSASNWYSDSLAPPISRGSVVFTTPTIHYSTAFYYSVTDDKTCESHKQQVIVQIHERPSQVFSPIESICPNTQNITASISTYTGQPTFLYVSSLNLDDFEPVIADSLKINNAITLPLNKSPGTYSLEFFTKNQYCFSDTSSLEFSIMKNTTIFNHLEDLVICEGESISFIPTYEAEPPLASNWLKDGQALPAHTNDSLLINSTTLSHSGFYQFSLSGQCGTVVSNEAEVTITPNVTILEQPEDISICENSAAKFYVKTENGTNLNYQWLIDGEPIGTNADSLVLDTVELTLSGSKIRCKIISDCTNDVLSNEATLTVTPLPEIPQMPEKLVFCTSANMVTLEISTLYTTNWFNEQNIKLETPTVNLNTETGKTYSVSYTNNLGCESPKKPFTIDKAPSFLLSIVTNVDALCKYGNFNKSGNIASFVSESTSETVTYQLLKNNESLEVNETGNFSVTEGGTYIVNAVKGDCSSSDTLVITLLGENLSYPPTIENQTSCNGNNLTLQPTSDYSSGNYYWWQSNTLIHEGETFTLENLQRDTSLYVSYGLFEENVFCETNRKQVEITLQNSLELNINITNAGCSDNGEVQILVLSGTAPFTFYLNDSLQNTSGHFTNLNAGTHALLVVDSNGCESDTTFSISNTQIISQHPTTVRVCSGNVANFNVVASDYDVVFWEKKLPDSNSFEIISNENTTHLRISNSGNAQFPHQTVVRAVFTKGDCQIYSNEASLLVNSITGTNPGKTTCTGSTLSFDLNSFTITGQVQSYQWQYRVGTTGSFTNLENENNSILTITDANESRIGYYRNRIVFDNNGSTCIINTPGNGMRLQLTNFAVPVIQGVDTVCSGQNTKLFVENCSGTLVWSNGITGLEISVAPTTNTSYTASCTQNGCTKISEPFQVVVKSEAVEKPTITTNKTTFCYGESIALTTNNCQGQIQWSTGDTGDNLVLTAESSFNIYAFCSTEECQSPNSDTLSITISPQLLAGTVLENNGQYCAGYNPPLIANLVSPNTSNIQWQVSNDCVNWNDISGATALTYNPDVLQSTTCYRRMVWNDCDTLYSNVVTIEVAPDPIISIEPNKTEICNGEELIVSHELIGGAGNCIVQWQINKVSASPSNANWRNLVTGDSLRFIFQNEGIDSTFHFRARVDYDVSSCNLANSNIVSAVFKSDLNFSTNLVDTTICAGTTLVLTADCKGDILWSTGSTLPQITIVPTENQTISVSCSNSCETLSDEMSISIVSGIEKPIILVDKTTFCYGESIALTANNCQGQIQWSTGDTGDNLVLTAESSFNTYAFCSTEECQSPNSDTLNITVNPQLLTGTIAENNGKYCAGYNPPVISSTTNPNTSNIQWQVSSNCIIWANISGATTLTYNPDVLQSATCYRRMVWNDCDTLYSNVVTIEVAPDPIISIESNKTEICSGEELIVSHELIGGAGNCTVQWQINKVSASPSNANWRNLTVGDSLRLAFQNTGVDSTFHFRARIDCDVSSCNLANSNIVSVIFKPDLNFSTNLVDTTICAGTTLVLTADCKGDLLWSIGSNLSQITIVPTENQTLSVSCSNDCETLSEEMLISVISGIEKPTITTNKTTFCYGESIALTANNCQGQVQWSTGDTGDNLVLTAESNFNIYAFCSTEECQSPNSDTLSITVSPQLLAGTVSENNGQYCAGYNPPVISSTTNPNTSYIQWQISSDCNIWTNLSGATNLTYNPEVLQSTTCYRRMVWNDCDTLYSNIVTIEVAADPIISIEPNKTEICSGEELIVSHELIGGVGNCTVQWQINKVSASPSNANWRNLTTGDSLRFAFQNTGNDSTFHFRARVDCDVSSCNLATSNVVSVVFKPELNFSTNLVDTTVCAGTTLVLTADCKGDILWSMGSTLPQITIAPTENQTISVSCSNDCIASSKSVNITVTPGISSPVNTTPDTTFTPNSIHFSATGSNLKWYSSINSNTPLDSAPILSTAGIYTFWVTQTIGGCESPKLQITSTLLATIKIISQTSSMANCYGNVSNLSVQAEGSGQLQYKWQRKLPDETTFSDVIPNNNLSRETTASLRIGNTGNVESPNGTLFRCIIRDNFGEFVGEAIPLTVNQLQGSLANKNLCLGEDLALDISKTHQITGNVLSVQWQHRPGTGSPWESLSDTGDVKGSNQYELLVSNLPVLDQVQYRCAITFSSNAGTCVETSDLMTLKVGSYPEAPPTLGQEVCQGIRLPRFTLYPPEGLRVVWYEINKNTPITTQPIINTNIPGNHLLDYVYKNALGCESKKTRVHVIVHEQPDTPINTTPEIYDETSTLTFSAVGENLKWYRTKTLKDYEDYPPTFTTTGKKSYYATQTSKNGCESERLQIQSEILPVFSITTQPQNRSNCDGNTVTFGVRLRGGTNPSYKWQQEYQGVFLDIPGELGRDLRITNAGEPPHIHGSKYRCIVKSEDKIIISEVAELSVNHLKTVLPQINLCPQDSLSFLRFKDNLAGIIQLFEWQKRIGTSYSTVFSGTHLNDYYYPDTSGSYRLRVTFHNLGGGTCIRNSNIVRLNKHELPKLENLDNISICEGETMTHLLQKLPQNAFLLNIDSSQVDSLKVLNSKQKYFAYGSNSAGCKTQSTLFEPKFLPAPILTETIEDINVCRFSNSEISYKILDYNTLWYTSESATSFTRNHFNTNTQESIFKPMYFKIEGENGCFSEKKEVQLNINPCYFKGQTDTCVNQENQTLNRNEWNYFYKENGEVFSSVHPNSLNLGRVNLSALSTKENVLNGINLAQFYPRSWRLSTSRELLNKVKIRLYLSLEEIKNYNKTPNDTVTILRKNQSSSTCEWEENHQWQLIDHDNWKEADMEGYYFIEFETDKTGDFVLWQGLIPTGKLLIKVPDNQIPEVTISDYKTLPLGKYIINKSEQGYLWTTWQGNILKNETMIDHKPFMYKNQYELVYDFENGIKAWLDFQEINISETLAQCTVLDNPQSKNDRTKVYFPNADKNKIQLTNLLGNQLPLSSISETDDYFELKPVRPLGKGTYILKMENRFGSTCIRKVIVY